MTGGDPDAYDAAYGALLDWVCNSLDLYKYELHAVTFPLFVHCFLELMAKGYADEAKQFFHKFGADHSRLHLEELRALGMIFTPQHVRENEYASQVLHSKFNVALSLLSFELLNTFLSQERLFLLLAILNERVNLVVASNHPGIQVDQLDDVADVGLDGPINSLEAKNNVASGYKSPDEVAEVMSMSDHPNESEIAATLASGPYDLEYTVRAAGGDGRTVENLNCIPIQWGVLPERKVRTSGDGTDGTGAPGSGADGDNSGPNSGVNGVSSSAGNGATGAGDSGSASAAAADGDKKNTSSGAASAGGADGGPAGSSGASKVNDKSGSKVAGADKAAASATPAGGDANRKHKRAKAGVDAAQSLKKGPLDEVGPLPDRKSPFNAEIMEKLVLRLPLEMKEHILEDLRVRATVNKSNLPSALCFTLLNSAVHINNMNFSDDVTMVGASCDDGSFRVWRNDDQPLGTATGSVYHGNMETDEEEKVAVLRGHSSAVYGADFSPDNRFALTASADSTIRLWSLAAKSNVVTYRSHLNYPVWDVNFAPYGYYFASCSMDRTARLWSTDHVTPLRVYAGHLSDVDCVRFHPNHNYLATGSSDKTVRLWDVQSGKCVRIFTGHFHGVRCLAFSSNGRYLASSGDDQYVNIWDLQAGKRLETLIGHKGTVTSLDFSQESAILASGGMDSTVRLWDMKTLTEQPSPATSGAVGGIAGSTGSSLSNGMANMHMSPRAGAGRAKRARFVKPVQLVRSSGVQDLPSSRFLLKTLRSKHTPIYRVQFTSRNLLLSGGVFVPKSDA